MFGSLFTLQAYIVLTHKHEQLNGRLWGCKTTCSYHYPRRLCRSAWRGRSVP